MGVNPNVSRRTFLTWFMAGLMTATLLAGLAPILVYIWPPPARGEKNADVKVALDKPLSQLQDGEAARFKAPDNTAFVMRDGGGDNAPGERAYSGYVVKQGSEMTFLAVNCSHLGCSVNFNKDGKSFDCPCHGSRFSLKGQVLHGPAAYPLSHLTAKTQGDDSILVSGITSTPPGA
jgi:Rieske Fe-S protein